MSGARSILILYGSQSGNSEEVAIQTGNAALKHDLQPTVRAMDEISVSDIPKQTMLKYIDRGRCVIAGRYKSNDKLALEEAKELKCTFILLNSISPPEKIE